MNADLRVLTRKMASVIITMKIMPQSPETDLEALKGMTNGLIKEFCGETETRAEEEPIGFGLKALKMTFVMDEAKGSTDDLESKISALEEVQSVEVTDVRRTIG